MKEVNPKDTTRAISYEYFINAPMPMVTIFKSLDVTKGVRKSKKGYKFNMLMCYAIARAASGIDEFYTLPIEKKLFRFDKLGINVVVQNKQGKLNTADIPFDENFDDFNKSYSEITAKVFQSGKNYELEDAMIIGTSTLAKYNIDGVVNMYSGIFNNPFLIWDRYSKCGFKRKLKLSFQFHHVQMDGAEACMFLERLQEELNRL